MALTNIQTITGAFFPDRWSNIGPFRSSAGKYYFLGRTAAFGSAGMGKMYIADTNMQNWTAHATGLSGSALTTAMNFASCYQVGDILHCFYNSSQNNYVYRAFNMATETWGTEELVYTPAIIAPATGYPFGSIVVRSTGEIVVAFAYGGHATMTPLERCAFKRKPSGGSWQDNAGGTAATAATIFDAQGTSTWLTPVAALGANDRVHLFCRNGTFVSGGQSYGIYVRTLLANNTLQAFDNTYTGSTSNAGIRHAMPNAASYVSGADTVVAGARSGSLTSSVANNPQDLSFTSGDAPTVAVADVSTGTTVKTIYTYMLAIDMVVDGTTEHVLWVDITSGDLMHDSNSGAGWGTDVNELAGTITGIVANVYTRGSTRYIGVVVDDAAVVKSGEISIGTAGSTQSQTQAFALTTTYSASKATSYYRTLVFTVSLLRSMLKEIREILTFTSTLTPTARKQVQETLAFLLTPTHTYASTKSFGRIISFIANTAYTVSRTSSIGRTLAFALSTSYSLIKQLQETLSFSVGAAHSVSRLITRNRTLAFAVSTLHSLTKAMQATKSFAVSSAYSLTRTLAGGRIVSFAVSAAYSAARQLQYGRAANFALSTAHTVRKQVEGIRLFSTPISWTVRKVAEARRSFSASTAYSIVAQKTYLRAIAFALSVVLSMQRQTSRYRTLAFGVASALTHSKQVQATRNFAASLTPTVVKRVSKTLGNLISTAFSYSTGAAGPIQRTINFAISTASSVRKTVQKNVQFSAPLVPTVQKSISKTLSYVVLGAFLANKQLSRTLAFATTLGFSLIRVKSQLRTISFALSTAYSKRIEVRKSLDFMIGTGVSVSKVVNVIRSFAVPLVHTTNGARSLFRTLSFSLSTAYSVSSQVRRIYSRVINFALSVAHAVSTGTVIPQRYPRRGAEVAATGVWTWKTLKNRGVTLPIYPNYQPEGQPGRAIVYHIQPGEDLVRHGKNFWSRHILTVWVQDAVGSTYPLREDAARIDDALQARVNDDAGLHDLRIYNCIRERPYFGQIMYRGVPYTQLGGQYRVLIGE